MAALDSHGTSDAQEHFKKRGDHRGRNADTPRQIPAPGWKDILVRVKHEVGEDRLTMIAAAMAYYALLASVPALSSLVLLYAWFTDPASISEHLVSVERFIPTEAGEIIRQQLTSLASKASSTLGFSALGTLLFSLWSASKGSSAVIEAMNIIYDEKECRGFFKRTGMAIAFTLLGTVLSLVAILVVVALPVVTGFFDFGALFNSLSKIVGWLLLLGILSFYISCMYRFGPCRERARWKWVSPGSVIASVLWAATSLLFSWYASNFANFNKTYGSLGAIVVMMTWFYLSSFIILLGGEINAEIEHQTKKDSTTGSPKPMGSRGAEMADTVGPSAEALH